MMVLTDVNKHETCMWQRCNEFTIMTRPSQLIMSARRHLGGGLNCLPWLPWARCLRIMWLLRAIRTCNNWRRTALQSDPNVTLTWRQTSCNMESCSAKRVRCCVLRVTLMKAKPLNTGWNWNNKIARIMWSLMEIRRDIFVSCGNSATVRLVERRQLSLPCWRRRWMTWCASYIVLTIFHTDDVWLASVLQWFCCSAVLTTDVRRVNSEVLEGTLNSNQQFTNMIGVIHNIPFEWFINVHSRHSAGKLG